MEHVFIPECSSYSEYQILLLFHYYATSLVITSTNNIFQLLFQNAHVIFEVY